MYFIIKNITLFIYSIFTFRFHPLLYLQYLDIIFILLKKLSISEYTLGVLYSITKVIQFISILYITIYAEYDTINHLISIVLYLEFYFFFMAIL